MWTIWRERNNRAFNAIELSTLPLRPLFFEIIVERMLLFDASSFILFLNFKDKMNFELITQINLLSKSCMLKVCPLLQ